MYQYVTSTWCLWPVIIRHLHPMHGLKHPHPMSDGKFGQVRHPHRHSQKFQGTCSWRPQSAALCCQCDLSHESPGWISWRKWPFFMTSNQTQPRNPSQKKMFSTSSTTKLNSSPGSHPCHGHPPPQPRGKSVFHLLLRSKLGGSGDHLPKVHPKKP